MKITKARLQEIIQEELAAEGKRTDMSMPALSPEDFPAAGVEEEERDMRTPAERYGKSMTEVGVLEELDGAIREAIQYVDIKNLRAFLHDALSTVL